jgi:hypothetical protein
VEMTYQNRQKVVASPYWLHCIDQSLTSSNSRFKCRHHSKEQRPEYVGYGNSRMECVDAALYQCLRDQYWAECAESNVQSEGVQ